MDDEVRPESNVDSHPDFPGATRTDFFSDAEIAARLGLDRETVRKIRCMSEWDFPIEVWRNAAEFKHSRRPELPLGCPNREIKDEPS